MINDSIILDTSPPKSLSILINIGANETNSTQVTLTLTAIDEHSGVFKMSFSPDGKTWSPWEEFNSTKSYILPAGNGNKTIYFRVKDLVGNIAQPISSTIRLNITSPQEKDTIEGEEPTSEKATPMWVYLLIFIIILIIIILIIGLFSHKRRPRPGYEPFESEHDDELFTEE